jgi:CheY-like chemotaxis protein
MATDVEESLAAGCAGYIAKPIDTRRLADEVRRYLAGVQ